MVFSRIVLPLDGSSDWESLIPHLEVLAQGEDCEILVLEAVSFIETLLEMPLALGPLELGGDTELAQAYVSAVARQLRERGLRTRELVQIGTPIATIAGVARRQKATLIALAVRERSGFPFSLFRTVSEQVLRASPTPIYVVPAVTTEEGVEPPGTSPDILVPVDGSGLSLQVIPAAAEFARRLSGRLVFVQVVRPGGELTEGARSLEAAKRRSDQEDVPAETVLRRGDPAEEILKLSRERRASLIAMRTRLSLGESHGPLGSVTVRILRDARVPLLIVRRPVGGPLAGAGASPAQARMGSTGA
ncbi:MAG TPA: universal stress protein [Planctomycetota bacterium]|nr:universal stress protein [Planctomycetota bacterium]